MGHWGGTREGAREPRGCRGQGTCAETCCLNNGGIVTIMELVLSCADSIVRQFVLRATPHGNLNCDTATSGITVIPLHTVHSKRMYSSEHLRQGTASYCLIRWMRSSKSTDKGHHSLVWHHITVFTSGRTTSQLMLQGLTCVSHVCYEDAHSWLRLANIPQIPLGVGCSLNFQRDGSSAGCTVYTGTWWLAAGHILPALLASGAHCKPDAGQRAVVTTRADAGLRLACDSTSALNCAGTAVATFADSAVERHLRLCCVICVLCRRLRTSGLLQT
jgi:hypothetical protein